MGLITDLGKKRIKLIESIEYIHGIKAEQLMILSEAGSNMYGTATENSDIDYIGVYLPTKEQILLNDFPKQVSIKENEIDLQIWSIYYFLKLACQGETLSIDLLHSPYHCWLVFNDNWLYIKDRKYKFYTKKMKAFVGYARKQAAKYGIKGERINDLKKVIDYLKTIDPKTKLKDIWHNLPTGEHIHFLDDEKPWKMYQVSGRKYQETVTVKYTITGLSNLLTDYGKRAIIASENKGIDWKAISHALRAGYQLFDILTKNGYEYPLTNAKFVKNVKLGKHDFKYVQHELDKIINAVEEKMEKSILPEKVNKEYWNEWLLKIIERHVNDWS